MGSFQKPAAIMLAALAFAAPAIAETPVESAVRQLGDQGYQRIEVTHTLLGRVKIEASRGDVEREIIMTRSGRILDDEVRGGRYDDNNGDSRGYGESSGGGLAAASSGSARSGRDDRHDDRFDDRYDDSSRSGESQRESAKDAQERDREAAKDAEERQREATKDAQEHERERQKDESERERESKHD